MTRLHVPVPRVVFWFLLLFATSMSLLWGTLESDTARGAIGRIEVLGSDAGSQDVPFVQVSPGTTIPCTVERVIDGDTLVCADAGRVRLLLIDAPELDQGPFGEVARVA
jgi:endonuclease YncB( thermonuclease family)